MMPDLDGWHGVDQLVLRDFSNSDEDGGYENMVKLSTPVLEANGNVDGYPFPFTQRIEGLHVHEGQICCTIKNVRVNDELVTMASVITARPQPKG